MNKGENMKIIIIFFILICMLNLCAEYNPKYLDLNQAVNTLIPHQKLLKTISAKGTIIDFHLADQTGELVIVEELGNDFFLKLYSKNAELLWEKKLKASKYSTSTYISDDASVILLNRQNLSGEKIWISTYNKKGELLGEQNNTNYTLELSGSGNLAFVKSYGIPYYDFDSLYRVKNVVLFDKYLKPIAPNGFIEDESIISCRVLSDSVIVCLRQYPLEDGSFFLGPINKKGKQVIELYSLKNNSMELLQELYNSFQEYDMISWQYSQESLTQIGDVIVYPVIYPEESYLFDLKSKKLTRYDEFISISSKSELLFLNSDASDNRSISKENPDKSVTLLMEPDILYKHKRIDFVNHNIVYQTDKVSRNNELEVVITDKYGKLIVLPDYKYYYLDDEHSYFISRKEIKYYGRRK